MFPIEIHYVCMQWISTIKVRAYACDCLGYGMQTKCMSDPFFSIFSHKNYSYRFNRANPGQWTFIVHHDYIYAFMYIYFEYGYCCNRSMMYLKNIVKAHFTHLEKFIILSLHDFYQVLYIWENNMLVSLSVLIRNLIISIPNLDFWIIWYLNLIIKNWQLKRKLLKYIYICNWFIIVIVKLWPLELPWPRRGFEVRTILMEKNYNNPQTCKVLSITHIHIIFPIQQIIYIKTIKSYP